MEHGDSIFKGLHLILFESLTWSGWESTGDDEDVCVGSGTKEESVGWRLRFWMWRSFHQLEAGLGEKKTQLERDSWSGKGEMWKTVWQNKRGKQGKVERVTATFPRSEYQIHSGRNRETRIYLGYPSDSVLKQYHLVEGISEKTREGTQKSGFWGHHYFDNRRCKIINSTKEKKEERYNRPEERARKWAFQEE